MGRARPDPWWKNRGAFVASTRNRSVKRGTPLGYKTKGEVQESARVWRT